MPSNLRFSHVEPHEVALVSHLRDIHRGRKPAPRDVGRVPDGPQEQLIARIGKARTCVVPLTKSDRPPVGYFDYGGLHMVLENKPGSLRVGGDHERLHAGWWARTPCAIGYILDTCGMDGDEIDIYLGTDRDVKDVVVITMMLPPDYTHRDEQKVGFFFARKKVLKQVLRQMHGSDEVVGDAFRLPFDEFKRQALATKHNPTWIVKE